MQLVLPFSYFVPDRPLQWVETFSFGASTQNYSVKASADALYIEVIADESATTNSPVKGWCMDIFNPGFVKNFLYPVMLSGVQDQYSSALWLQKNTPEVFSYSNNFTNQWNVTYRPGNALEPGHEGTIPEQATHQITNDKSESHSKLHMTFGTNFAKSVIQNLPVSLNQLQTPFVISDSTSPGAGSLGVAHILSRHDASYDDVKRSIVSMINYGIFGIPNVGPHLCDFALNATFDPVLCDLYFKLAVVSPLAFYSDRLSNLTNHVYNNPGGSIEYG